MLCLCERFGRFLSRSKNNILINTIDFGIIEIFLETHPERSCEWFQYLAGCPFRKLPKRRVHYLNNERTTFINSEWFEISDFSAV